MDSLLNLKRAECRDLIKLAIDSGLGSTEIEESMLTLPGNEHQPRNKVDELFEILLRGENGNEKEDGGEVEGEDEKSHVGEGVERTTTNDLIPLELVRLRNEVEHLLSEGIRDKEMIEQLNAKLSSASSSINQVAATAARKHELSHANDLTLLNTVLCEHKLAKQLMENLHTCFDSTREEIEKLRNSHCATHEENITLRSSLNRAELSLKRSKDEIDAVKDELIDAQTQLVVYKDQVRCDMQQLPLARKTIKSLQVRLENLSEELIDATKRGSIMANQINAIEQVTASAVSTYRTSLQTIKQKNESIVSLERNITQLNDAGRNSDNLLISIPKTAAVYTKDQQKGQKEKLSSHKGLLASLDTDSYEYSPSCGDSDNTLSGENNNGKKRTISQSLLQKEEDIPIKKNANNKPRCLYCASEVHGITFECKLCPQIVHYSCGQKYDEECMEIGSQHDYVCPLCRDKTSK